MLAPLTLICRALGALSVLALLAACATPAARIKRNQALFDSLAPAEQTLIREGKIAIGFTPEMVRLAVGDPDQRWLRTDAGGKSEVWSYTTYDGADGGPLLRGHYHRANVAYPLFYDGFVRGGARAREYFRVGFSEGRVGTIEQVERPGD